MMINANTQTVHIASYSPNLTHIAILFCADLDDNIVFNELT